MTGEPDLVEALGEIIPWCQGTNELHARAIAEIERLTDAIRRIDGINDNPADYNPAINAVCDAILRPRILNGPKP